MTTPVKRILWTSSLDLSTAGIETFCREAAPRYGKTEQELKAMAPMDLAIKYMRPERDRAYKAVFARLSEPTGLPILVILDKADFCNQSHMECSVLSGEHLSQILSCPNDGISVTFYSDGNNIRCECLTDFGADHYLFREVTSLHNFASFIERIERGEAFTESDLGQNTKSLLPQISKLMEWDTAPHASLSSQISDAKLKVSSNTKPIHSVKTKAL